MSRRVLVTGAGGFIGGHLVEELVRRGHRVRALVRYNGRSDAGSVDRLPPDVRREVDVVFGDITDPYAPRAAVRGHEIVFHLAALIAIPYSYQAPHVFFATNTLGSVHMLEAARVEGVARFVHVSTSETYGSGQQLPMNESHPLVAQSPYAASKIGADHAAESYRRAFDVPVVIVRPFNTYGPRQSARAIIPTILTQAFAHGLVKLGALHPTRDLTFVEDTVDGMIRAGFADAAAVVGQTINLGSGREISIGDLAAKIIGILAEDGIEATLEHDGGRVRPQASEVLRLCADSTKATRLLGWIPRVPLTDGLRRTAAAIRAELDLYKPGVYAR